MTTNILVSIAMAPFEPLEDREWAVIGGCKKNIGLRFRCHAQIPTQCSGELVGKDAGTLGPEINIAFRVGQTNAM